MACRAVPSDLALDVATDAEAHVVDVVHLVDLRHAGHITMACGARVGTQSLDVLLVGEVDMLCQEMDANPLDRLLLVPRVPQLANLR
jgi:hypothetical protein